MENLDTLKRLKDLLPCERFILGGSHAMQLHGITLTREPGDFDIIVELPYGNCHDTLDRLQKQAPNPKMTETSSMAYSFFYESIKFDVWIKTTLSEYPLLSYEGVLVNSVTDIVDWKMKFKRSKDWVQLMQWALSIFDMRKFEKELMEIGTQGDGNISSGDLILDNPVKKYDPLDDFDDLPF